MSFQALARTWRPRRFDALVGQAHVVRALTHALEQDKLHHALLFSGTRGVGKTTLARIIAKCLNCEQGVTAQPCAGPDPCAACREIDEGRFVDLIEVDAASRTGVDDTRELMDNVQYAPTRGRTKVYLIDEVHMLSKHSFNALLKTLEEPPPRVQFLLATTEPEKIPVTILSRCLQFPLKRLSAAEIAVQLRHIVDAEALTADDDALTEVARAADGSMRDGLSLLDQAIAFGGGALHADAVRDMLGTIGHARVAELVEAIVEPAAGRALDALDALYAQGIDMRYLLEALAGAWQQIATIQIVGEAVDEQAEAWQQTAQRASAGAVQVFYDIAIAGLRDLAYAPDPMVGTKMTVLRMLAFAPAAAGQDTSHARPSGGGASGADPADSAREGAAAVRARLEQGSTRTGAGSGEKHPDNVNGDAGDGAHVRCAGAARPTTTLPGGSESPVATGSLPADATCVEAAPANAPAATKAANTTDHPEDWHRIAGELGLHGIAAELANNGVCRHLDDTQVVLELARANELLATPGARETLQQALVERWAPGAAPKLSVRLVDEAQDTPAMRRAESERDAQRAAEAAIENDPFVRELKDRLGAELRSDTVKPNRRDAAMQSRDKP